MSLTNVTAKVTYVADGATNVFPITFPILGDGDVIVTRFYQANSSTNVLTLNTDYQVSGTNIRTTGNYLNIPSGSLLVIQRDLDLTQTVDYVENTAFPAETQEQI